MFFNAQIALAILSFSASVSLASPITINSGKGAIDIPAGAEDIRVHQSYNKHHHHQDSSDPYEETVRYKLPHAARHEKAQGASHHVEVGKSSKHKGKEVERRRHERDDDVIYSHGRHGTTIIQDGHRGHRHGATVITGGRHSGTTVIARSHDHDHDHDRHDRGRETIIYDDDRRHHLHSRSVFPEARRHSDDHTMIIDHSGDRHHDGSRHHSHHHVDVIEARRHSGKTVIIDEDRHHHHHHHDSDVHVVHARRHSDDRTVIVEQGRHRHDKTVIVENGRHRHHGDDVRVIHARHSGDRTVIYEDDSDRSRHGHGHGHGHSHRHDSRDHASSDRHSHKEEKTKSKRSMNRSGRFVAQEKRGWVPDGTAGFIDVTSPIFGSDIGEKIASLVLSTSNMTTSSVNNSSFVLNASNSTKTQVYLVPVNITGFSAADVSDSSSALIEVSLQIPVFSPALAAMVPYCATFDPNPPAPGPLMVQSCDTPPSDHSSHRFVYIPSTGVVRPLWTSDSLNNASTSSTNATAPLSRRDYLVKAAAVKPPTPAFSSLASRPSSVAASLPSSKATPSTAPSSSAAAASPSSSVTPAESVSLVFTPVSAAAILASSEKEREHIASSGYAPSPSSKSSSAPPPSPTATSTLPFDAAMAPLETDMTAASEDVSAASEDVFGAPAPESTAAASLAASLGAPSEDLSAEYVQTEDESDEAAPTPAAAPTASSDSPASTPSSASSMFARDVFAPYS